VIGFEIEIALPVTGADGGPLRGDEELGRLTGFPIRVVTDSRGAWSNIEFVTGPVSVVGAAAVAGAGTLAEYVGAIRAVRDRLYAAGAVPLAAAGGNLLTPLGTGLTALLDPNDPDYEEDAHKAGGGDGLLLHYSIGVPLKALNAFFDFLRTRAPYAPAQASFLKYSRFRLSQAATVADRGVAAFERMYPRATAAQRLQARGYLQSVYTQVAAMADYVAKPQDKGQIKNHTVALCRSAFFEVFPRLDADVQAFLAAGFGDDSLVNLVADFQGVSDVGKPVDFQENSTRFIDGVERSLMDYTRSALTGAPAVTQQQIFGSMTQVAPHGEDGVLMVPFEVRTMGAHYKTWHEVGADLTAIVQWVRQAHAA
jgi:hypothetical protein